MTMTMTMTVATCKYTFHFSSFLSSNIEIFTIAEDNEHFCMTKFRLFFIDLALILSKSSTVYVLLLY